MKKLNLLLLLLCWNPVFGQPKKNRSDANQYELKFSEEGLQTAQSLLAVLRTQDKLRFIKPPDTFTAAYKKKLEDFPTAFSSRFPVLKCQQPVLEKLFCNKPDLAGCLKPVSDSLMKSLPADRYTVESTKNSPEKEQPGSWEYKIRQQESENQLIAKWLGQKRSLYRGFRVSKCPTSCDNRCNADLCPTCTGETCDCPDARVNFWKSYYELNTAYTALYLEYNSVLAKQTIDKDEYQRLCTLINQANEPIYTLDNVVSRVVNGNKQWMLAWLWYTDGVPKLNPFGTSDTTDLSAFLRSRITTLSASIGAYQHSLTGYITPGVIQSQPVIAQLARELDALKIRLAQLPLRRKAYNVDLKKLSIRSKLLYKGEFYISDENGVAWMPQYDVSKAYRKVADGYPDQISEQDEMRPLVHNLETNQTVLLKEKIEQVANVTQFERRITPLLEGVGAVAPQEFNLFDKIPKGAGEVVINDRVQILRELEGSLSRIQSTLLLADWLAEQSEPPKEIELEDGIEPAYRTEWVKPEEPTNGTGSNKITYTILETINDKQKVVVRDETYTKYELTRFSPAAGIVYHVNDRRYASVFTDGTFSDEPFNQIDFVFGVKIYPWKTNVQYIGKTAKAYGRLGDSYNRLRGNNILNRVSGFVGLGTQKIFRNYYVGVGIDPLPFLQIQVGWNWYIQKRYEFKNNALVRTRENLEYGGMYVSAALPLNVVTKLIKFLNPF